MKKAVYFLLILIVFLYMLLILSACADEPEPQYPLKDYNHIVQNLTGNCKLKIKKAESTFWNIDLPNCTRAKIDTYTKNMLCTTRGGEFCK